MPLIPKTLNVALEEAFNKALLVFAETIKNNPPGVDVSDNARNLAAKTFANIATPAIDLYIKSQTIIIPPGQAVVAPPPSGAGTTIAPSSPAIIT